jgi:hypothetical protein
MSNQEHRALAPEGSVFKCKSPPQRLKPDFNQGGYRTPEGRTLQKLSFSADSKAPKFKNRAFPRVFQTRGNAGHINFRALALVIDHTQYQT